MTIIEKNSTFEYVIKPLLKLKKFFTRRMRSVLLFALLALVTMASPIQETVLGGALCQSCIQLIKLYYLNNIYIYIF
uniref:Saposin B-type domain-containing protein n=1 Tax=Heterorhabditis bacteriophora TaxID=37862 RepID=A0A1I7WZR1_HETBA